MPIYKINHPNFTKLYSVNQSTRIKSQKYYLANDENTIVEIFASRPKNLLEIVDLAYKKFFKISLRDDVKKQGSKEYAQLLVALMDIERPLDQTVSGKEAYDMANELIKNGLKIYVNDINLFKKIFVEKSNKDLILI